MKALRFFVLLCLVFAGTTFVAAQSAISVKCGEILEDEFTTIQEEKVYAITMAPGDILDVTSSRIGDQLKMTMQIVDPVGNVVTHNESLYRCCNELGLTDNPVVSTGVLSGRGDYLIQVTNHIRFIGDKLAADSPDYRGGIGVFTLYLGCTLRDGTVIAPGDGPVEAPADNSGGGTTPDVPAFSGVGFPGLPPKDLNTLARLPLPAGMPVAAALTPTGAEIYGFNVDANSGQILNLAIGRISGNLNVAIVILTPDNQVAQALILTTTTTLNTDLPLTMTGQYTIAVFRVDLLVPTAPEATIFQLTGSLNP